MSTSWYPFILGEMCNGCMACLEYCERDVYEEVETAHGLKARAKNRENCKEGCKECAQYCTFGAIIFQDQYEGFMKKGYASCSCGGHLMTLHCGGGCEE